MHIKNAVILDAARSAMGRSNKGAFIHSRIDDMGVRLIREMLARNPAVKPEMVEDVLCGCAFPEGEQGMNIARNMAIMADLPVETAGATINRFCGSSMEAAHIAFRNVMTGNDGIYIAMGIEHMTHIPMGGFRAMDAANPQLLSRQGLWPMPQTAQNVADDFEIGREDMDRFAYESHVKAHKAAESGAFKNEIIPVTVPKSEEIEKDGKKELKKSKETFVFDRDECIRPDTTVEALAQLKPIKGVFSMAGKPVNITAGNSCPVNDGVAALLITSEENAERLGFKPLARFVSSAVAGVHPKIMGMGPWPATEKALARAGMSVGDIDLFELNEAFASQSLACIQKLELPPEKVNVNGGAIALGHPLGASGARLLVTLVHAMKQRGAKRGVATMCIGGGQGIATVVEAVK